MDKQPKRNEEKTGFNKNYKIGCIVLLVVGAILGFALFFGYMEF